MRLTTIYLDCTTNHIELRENVLIVGGRDIACSHLVLL